MDKIEQLIKVIKELGWSIALPIDEADDQFVRGMIIGKPDYIEHILEQLSEN